MIPENESINQTEERIEEDRQNLKERLVMLNMKMEVDEQDSVPGGLDIDVDTDSIDGMDTGKILGIVKDSPYYTSRVWFHGVIVLTHEDGHECRQKRKEMY